MAEGVARTPRAIWYTPTRNPAVGMAIPITILVTMFVMMPEIIPLLGDSDEFDDDDDDDDDNDDDEIAGMFENMAATP